MTIWRGRDGEFAPRSTAAAGLTRVDIGPRRAVIGRTPDADIIGGSVEHARRATDRPRKPLRRGTTRSSIRMSDRAEGPSSTGLGWNSVKFRAAIRRLPDADTGVPGGICETAPAVVEEMPCTPRPEVT